MAELSLQDHARRLLQAYDAAVSPEGETLATMPDAAPAGGPPVQPVAVPVPVASPVPPADATFAQTAVPPTAVMASQPTPDGSMTVATPQAVNAAQNAQKLAAAGGQGVPLTPEQAQQYQQGQAEMAPPIRDQDIEKDEGREAKRIEGGLNQELKGDAAGTQAEIDKREVERQYKERELTTAQDELAGQKLANETHNKVLDEITHATQYTRDMSLKMMNENPRDLWGNASTGGKIAGIIGLVAAGLSHPGGAMERLTQMTNEAVAEQTRRNQYLKQYSDENDNLLKNVGTVWTDQNAQRAATKAAMLDIIGQQMALASSKTLDATARAKLDMLQGSAKQAAGKEILNAQHIQYTDRMANAKLDMEQRAARAGAGGTGWKLEGFDGDFDEKNHAGFMKAASTHGSGIIILQTQDELAERAKQLLALEKTDPKQYLLEKEYFEQRVKDNNTAFRQFILTGAVMDAGEKEDAKAQYGKFALAVAPSEFLREYNAQTEAAQRKFVLEQIRRTVESNSGGRMHMNENHPLWKDAFAKVKAHDENLNKAVANSETVRGIRGREGKAEEPRKTVSATPPTTSDKRLADDD